MREFLYADKLADARVLLAESGYDGWFVNVDSGEVVTIGQLAELVTQVVGFRRRVFPAYKPDATLRELYDASRLAARRRPTGARALCISSNTTGI
jgi:GDP-L-fucose synthase